MTTNNGFMNADDLYEGSDADLPIEAYIAAADEADDNNADAHPEDTHDDDLRDAALRALVENSMLAGPDPEILAEIQGHFPEGEEWAEDIEAHFAEEEHVAALTQAAQDVEVSERVEEIYQSIIARAPEHKVQPSTQRVEDVLDILGDPHQSYPSIHVTGTNGKTSTTRMIDSLLSAAGMKTGRITSPHLVNVRERISFEGESISPVGFIRAWEDVQPYIDMVDMRAQEDPEASKLSFFEAFTVMALAAFADYPVDVAVLEVGMGGRWDATNVVDAGVGVITPISMDHEKWLGTSLADIASEKAGIIKPGQITVISRQNEEVEEILLREAASVDAVVRLEGRDFEVLDRTVAVGGQLITVRTPAAVYEDVFVPLFGDYQAHNAAAAIVAVEAFMGGRALDPKLVESGMMAVTSPGRLQVIRRSPTVIVDAAHNPGAAATLGKNLQEFFGFSRTVGVFSAMADKHVEAILTEVEPYLDHLVVTEMAGERAMGIDDLASIAIDIFGEDRVSVEENLVGALDIAVTQAESGQESADHSGVVVFGSIVLGGQVIDLMNVGR